MEDGEKCDACEHVHGSKLRTTGDSAQMAMSPFGKGPRQEDPFAADFSQLKISSVPLDESDPTHKMTIIRKASDVQAFHNRQYLPYMVADQLLRSCTVKTLVNSIFKADLGACEVRFVKMINLRTYRGQSFMDELSKLIQLMKNFAPGDV